MRSRRIVRRGLSTITLAGLLLAGGATVAAADDRHPGTVRGADADGAVIQGDTTVLGAPVAVDDFAATFPDTLETVFVLDNDSDPDGDAIEVVSFSATSANGGTVECGPFCDYTPATGFTGTDTFTYTIADIPGGQTDTATVTVSVASCPQVGSALGAGGLVVSESWTECSAPDANGVTTLTPAGMSSANSPRVLLTSGAVSNAAPPNDEAGATTDSRSTARGALDVSILKLDLNVPGDVNCVSFDLVFGSEEYPEYVGDVFNDAFLAELDVSDWSVDGETITAPHNFATDPEGNLISVNSVFFGAVVEVNGTEYDGTTPLVSVRTAITSGAHSLYLSIFDASDGILDSGAFVDNLAVSLTPPGGCDSGATVLDPPPPDFEGDGDTDRSVFRNGAWYAEGQTPGFLGQAGDIPVAADYDGDGDDERAVYRNGTWFIDGQANVFLGLADDVPVPADYDGDGDDDPAVWRPATGAWYVQGQAPAFFGLDSDIPVPADYVGLGPAQRAVWRPSVGGWYIDDGGAAPTVFMGLTGDVPIPGDYDGDGDTDRGVWRPSVGGWYIQGQTTVFVGLNGDVPVPGDYNADGITNRAIWRPSVGGWYVDGLPTVFLGLNGDIPLPLPQAIYRRFF